MWQYEIATGRLYDDSGEVVATGYSGSGDYKNDANAQSMRNLGPIPEGLYLIGLPRNTVTHGPFVLPLEPNSENLMWGRSGFLIHGDSVVDPGSASEGCIIMPRAVREQIANSQDHDLKVVDLIGETT